MMFKNLRVAVGYPLCHENIRLAKTIRIGDDADNHKATFLVELERMTALVAEVPDVRPDIRVELHTAALVVGNGILAGFVAFQQIGALRIVI